MNRNTVTFLSAHLYSYFFPDKSKEKGGVSRIYKIVRGLSALPDFKVCCFIENFGQPSRLDVDGVELIRSPIARMSMVLGVYIDLLRHRTDLLIDFYASSRLSLLAWMKVIHGRRFAFFVGSDMDVNGGYLSLSNPLHNWLYEWGLRQADRIICQTPAQAVTLRKTFGIDSTIILSPYVEITESMDVPKQYILWVGRIASYKRPDYFVDLAEALPSEKFVMVCNPSSKDKTAFAKLLARVERLPNVRFIDSVPHSQMRDLYAAAKLLVNTSDFEGFPNTFIESALECTPVVSLNVDPNGMLGRYGAGIWCGGDWERMPEACMRLSRDGALAEEMGKRARQYAVEYHNIDEAIGKIAQVLKETINGAG